MRYSQKMQRICNMHTYYDVCMKLRFSLPEHLVHVVEDKPTEFSCIQYMYMLPLGCT